MATSTDVNATLIKYDATSNQTIIYPKTKGSNITIDANTNLTSATNLQTLISSLGSLAFRSYTIVTDINSASSGTLVDGSVVHDLNTTLTSIQQGVSNMANGTDTGVPFQVFFNASAKGTPDQSVVDEETGLLSGYDTITINGNTYSIISSLDVSSFASSIVGVTSDALVYTTVSYQGNNCMIYIDYDNLIVYSLFIMIDKSTSSGNSSMFSYACTSTNNVHVMLK